MGRTVSWVRGGGLQVCTNSKPIRINPKPAWTSVRESSSTMPACSQDEGRRLVMQGGGKRGFPYLWQPAVVPAQSWQTLPAGFAGGQPPATHTQGNELPHKRLSWPSSNVSLEDCTSRMQGNAGTGHQQAASWVQASFQACGQACLGVARFLRLTMTFWKHHQRASQRKASQVLELRLLLLARILKLHIS